MKKSIKRLSVLIALLVLSGVPEADSLFLSAEKVADTQITPLTSKDQIIPLIYIKNIEYYNQTQSEAFTPLITEYLSLEPSIIVTDDESVADYNLIPKLVQSKIEPLNENNFRYSISVSAELWSQGGIKVASVTKDRYVIVKKTQDVQLVAKQLLKKLLQEAVNTLILKIRNNELKAG